MESTENNVQETSKATQSAAQQEAAVVETKAQQAGDSAKETAKTGTDSVVNDLKAKGGTVLQNIKKLPGAPKAKLFLGLGLVVTSLFSYLSLSVYPGKFLYILLTVFYPIIVASITILSAYNQKDFFEELFAKKNGKTEEVEHPEIHHEDDIHETHQHEEEKTEA